MVERVSRAGSVGNAHAVLPVLPADFASDGNMAAGLDSPTDRLLVDTATTWSSGCTPAPAKMTE